MNRGGISWRWFAGVLVGFAACLVAVSFVSYRVGENHSRVEPVSVGARPVAATTPTSSKGVVSCQPGNGGLCTVSDTTSTVPQPSPTVPPTAGIDQALASCSVPESGVAKTPTESVFLGHLIGTWMLCHTPSVFGSKEAGMRIMANGTWSNVSRNRAGQLVEIPGWGNNGTWTVVDISAEDGAGTYQLNFKVDGTGEVFTIPVFSSGPAKMRLDNNGMFVADYVPVSAPVASKS